MTAKVITFFNQKGGSGKTTTCIQVGGTLGRRGHKTLIVDMDPQNTATRWSMQAPDEFPFPTALMNIAIMEGRMHREVKNQIELYDYILIDCPPALNSPAPSSAMLISDLALIPVVPAPADMWAAQAAKELARRAQETNPTLIVRMLPNMVKKTNLAKDSLEIMGEDHDIPLMKSWLGTRAAFQECQLLGSTVHRVPRSQAAIDEVESLVDEVLSLVGKPTKGKVQ